MVNEQNNSAGILLGAVVGGLLIGASAGYLTFKVGKKIKQEYCGGGEGFGDKIEKIVGVITETLKSRVSDQVNSFTETSKEALDCVKNKVESVIDLEDIGFKEGLCAGGVAGVLLGIGGTLMFKSCFRDEEIDTKNNMSCQLLKWKKVIRDVLETTDECPKPAKANCSRSNNFNDLIDMAVLGHRLWQTIRNR